MKWNEHIQTGAFPQAIYKSQRDLLSSPRGKSLNDRTAWKPWWGIPYARSECSIEIQSQRIKLNNTICLQAKTSESSLVLQKRSRIEIIITVRRQLGSSLFV